MLQHSRGLVKTRMAVSWLLCITYLGPHTPRVHDALRNTLAVELCKLLLQVEVFQQHRACGSKTC